MDSVIERDDFLHCLQSEEHHSLKVIWKFMKWVIKNKWLSKTLPELSRKLETSNPTEKTRSKGICTYRFGGICISQLGEGKKKSTIDSKKNTKTKPNQTKRLIGCENTWRSFKSYICSCIPSPYLHTHHFTHYHSHHACLYDGIVDNVSYCVQHNAITAKRKTAPLLLSCKF